MNVPLIQTFNDWAIVQTIKVQPLFFTNCMFQVKNYYSFKKKHKNMYEGLIPSSEKNVFNHDVLTVLPMRDQEGRRMLVLELGS